MNFLAHLYLSGDNPSILIGNFIGDFVKGRNNFVQYGSEIAKGIELHRAIDAFTDTHSVVQQSKNRLRPKYRHYSGVIIDIFYDHYLAKNWNEYHSEFLPDYADKVYDLIQTHLNILPEKVNWILPYMIKGNWLLNYGKLEGIERALIGLSRRSAHDSKMNESVHELKEFYPEFKKEFEEFFPELKNYCDNWITLNG